MLDVRASRSRRHAVVRFALALALVLTAGALISFGAGDVLAQTAGTGAGAASSAAPIDLGEYVPADPAQRQETVSASLMVTLAYTLMWLAVVVFLVAMLRRSQTLRQDVAAARAQLATLDERIERLMKRGGGQT